MTRRLCLVLLLWLGLAAGLARAQAPGAWAYAAWWLPQGWKTVPLRAIERLLFFHVTIQADGRLQPPEGWPGRWTDMLEAAREADCPVDLTLTLLDARQFHALFSKPAAVRRLLDQAVAMARTPGIAGLHLDVELYDRLDPKHLLAYQRFVRALAERLRHLPERRTLSAFVPMGGRMPLYTPQTLALFRDVVLQGYDAHWQDSPQAGPVAPLDGPEALTWRHAVQQADHWGLARDRVRLSFPLYGYEWTVDHPAPRSSVLGRGDITAYSPLPPEQVPDVRISVQERVGRHGVHHDAASASAYYQFRDDQGRLRVGWFEDIQTLERKIDFLRRERVGGLAFFPLGYDDGQLVRHYLQHPLTAKRP